MEPHPLFFTIDRLREETVKIRRSVFTCRLSPTTSIQEAKAFISEISKTHKNATHNCWAYIIGDQGEAFHCSDAGEPAGTAGKPILNALQSHAITQVAAVVTRYYGGVKLGVRGLIDAYEASVLAAIEQAPLIKRVRLVSYRVTLAYDFNDFFLARIKPHLNQIIETEYSEEIVHTLDVEESRAAAVTQLLTTLQSQQKLGFQIIISD